MPEALFPFQEEGAAIMAAHERFGLHDEPGVGKTAQVIRGLDLLQQRRGILVVPSSLRENWLREFRKFAHIDRRLIKMQSVHDLIAWQRGRFETIIMSYEAATKYAPKIQEQCEILDFLHMDEAHYLKTHDSKRSIALLGRDSSGQTGICKWAINSWHVTGSRIPNDPVDVFTFLKFSRAIGLTLGEFIDRYLEMDPDSMGKKYFVRDDMAGELNMLLNKVSVSRTKADVGIQLPDIFLTEVIMEGDTTEIRKLIAEYPGLEHSIVDAVERGGLSFLDAQHIATLRRLIGTAKAIPFAEMLLDEARVTNEKYVIMGLHKDALIHVVNYIRAHSQYGVVLINGDTSERMRSAAVDAFQTDPSCRFFVGNMVAAGVGLTLTAGCEMFVLESAWTPATNWQAMMRVHRIGQTRQVRARFITLADSVDVQVNGVVARKTAEIAKIELRAMNASPR